MQDKSVKKSAEWGWLIGWFVLVLMLALATTSFAENKKSQVKERAIYHKLLNERQVIRQRLNQLDRRAAHLMQQGQDPVVLHAEQVSLQDKLDLIELRLEIVAARLGLEVPVGNVEAEAANPDEDPVKAKAYKAFERGRNRTMVRLRQDAKRLLSSINFTRFLAEPVEDDFDD
ncbi:hypothetical protein [Poriferisphaera sp. WC338]|uniref:hypothetical protein n=1 Tax=Poriferisphaera sp. WC338 TaxID=3425129 RepID=UPI003D81951D